MPTHECMLMIVAEFHNPVKRFQRPLVPGIDNTLKRECRNWITDLIKVEELYCTELDKVLIPASSSVFKFNRRKSAEEQYLACQKDFKTQPELEFIVDYCDCRIQLIKLFVQLYHNVGRPDVGFSTDFINIYQLFHKGEDRWDLLERFVVFGYTLHVKIFVNKVTGNVTDPCLGRGK